MTHRIAGHSRRRVSARKSCPRVSGCWRRPAAASGWTSRDALRLELRGVYADRAHDARRRARAAPHASTRSIWARWAFPGCRTTSRSGGLLIPIRREFHQYREPAAGAAPPRGALAARCAAAPPTSTCLIVREKQRMVSTPRSAGGSTVTRPRAGRAAVGVHPPGLRPGDPLRLRAAKKRPAPPRHLGHQVERDHSQHAVLGRGASPRWPGDYPREDQPVPHRHPHRPTSSSTRTGSTWWCLEPLRRHPLGPGAGHRGLDRDRAGRQHQPGEGVTVPLFEPVHGSAPDIAGKGIAQPDRQIWTGAMDALPPGASRGGPGRSWARSSASWRKEGVDRDSRRYRRHRRGRQGDRRNAVGALALHPGGRSKGFQMRGGARRSGARRTSVR